MTPFLRMAYRWRELTPEERAGIMAWRKKRSFPWHSPPHVSQGRGTYHLTAACLNHQAHIGRSPERMEEFCGELMAVLEILTCGIHAWCVLPNHYHLLVTLQDLRECVGDLGKLHGRTSYQWNIEDGQRGRQTWHGAADRWIRGDRHFWATMNYVHHNPVHHGYVTRWLD